MPTIGFTENPTVKKKKEKWDTMFLCKLINSLIDGIVDEVQLESNSLGRFAVRLSS